MLYYCEKAPHASCNESQIIAYDSYYYHNYYLYIIFVCDNTWIILRASLHGGRVPQLTSYPARSVETCWLYFEQQLKYNKQNS